MNTNGHEEELLLKDEVYRIIGCALEVLNDVGHGFHEKPYENALAIEFQGKGITFEQQPRFPISYKGQLIGEFVPDLVAFGAVVVDTKVVSRITDHERGQMLNYLRATGLRVGLIINFSKPRLEWERLVL